MTSKEAREKMDKALDNLAELIEKGQSQAMLEYLSTMSRFHRYSWGNVLLIFTQNPEATHVAGFNTWKQVGRFVKKGEKGLMILAPCSGKKKRTKTGEDGSETEEESRSTFFRPVYVFDVSQTEGKDLPEPERVKGDVSTYLPRLEAFVTGEMACKLQYTTLLPPSCYGASSNGMIELRSGMEPPHAFAVLCHEVAHEVLHWSLSKEMRANKTLVETQAEATAYVVCSTLGLDPGSSASDYIQLYKGNRETLRQSLQAIQKAAGSILEGLGKAQKAPKAAPVPAPVPAPIATHNPQPSPELVLA